MSYIIEEQGGLPPVNDEGCVMDIEFHYYITYIIAQRDLSAEDAYIIAYSSQLWIL
jgi:hypothetical protein